MCRQLFAATLSIILMTTVVSFGQNVAPLGFTILRDHSYDVEVSGSNAFLAHETRGLMILDVSNPSSIEELDSLLFTDTPRDVVISDTLAYVTADDGIHVVDISDLRDLVEVGFTSLEMGYGCESVLYGPYLITGGSGHLFALDINDPLTPVVVGTLGFEDMISIGGIAIWDHYAVIALSAFFGGIEIVDLSDPTNPQSVGHADTDDWAHSVTVFGNHAALAVDYAGVQIFDISLPTSPQLESTIVMEDAITNSIASAGNFVYAAGQDERLHIFNLDNPSNPISVGTSPYDLGGTEIFVSASGEIMYTADGVRFEIFDCSAALPVDDEPTPYLPADISLLAYPNPFNPTTTLTFSVAHEAEVRLIVFDVNGRLVSEVVRGKFTAGTHAVNWSCSECTSGIYFAAMNAGSFTASQKLLLLK